MRKFIGAALGLLLILTAAGGCGKKEATKMSSIDDLADKRIGVYTGTIYDKFAVKRFPRATILRYNSISDFILALKNHKIDAAISNLYSAKNVMKSNPEIGILTDDLLSFPIGIGFNKNNPALREKFNRFLRAAKTDGTFDAMVKKWFDNDPEKVPMPEFPAAKAAPKIILGVAVGDLPNVGVVNGQYVGFDVELLRTFAAKEGLRLEIITMEFGSLVAALAAGKVDMIADCIAITKERQAQVDFSDPYLSDKSAIITLKENLAVAAENATTPSTMAEIARGKVAVLQGSVHDSFMNQNYPGAQVFQYKSLPDLVLAVQSGKVDAGFMVSESFKDLQKENHSLEMLVDKVFTVDIGMGFNKDNAPLREKFNAFLKEIKANCVYDDWVRRWFKEDSTAMPTIENKKNNGKLVIGTVSDKGLPFTIVRNNQLIGSDIELVERFAAYLGKEPVFSDMEFANLIAAVSTHKVDMIASTVMITEERKKQIDFSDPYYKLSACVFGAKKAPQKATSFWQGLVGSFNSNIIQEQRYLLILDGLKITAIISILSIFFGTLLGALICFLRMSRRKAFQGIARFYISLIRGIPVLVLLMLIFYVVFAKVNIDPVLVAVIAFGINFAAYVSEMFRTAIESIDKGQTEAGIAAGFTKVQTFLYIVMPQALRQALPVYKGELISLVKMTSIVGYIAVQDLTKASDIIRSRTFDAFFPLIMTAVLYFGISALLLSGLNVIERRVDPKRRRRTSSGSRMRLIALSVVFVIVLAGLIIPSAFQRSAATKNQPITQLEHLDGKRICVITGTTGDFAVRKRFKRAQVLDMLYPADAALAVRTGKADAFVFDKSTLRYIVTKSNGELKLVPGKLASVDIAIPMRRNDSKLQQSVNSAIAKLKNDGTLEKMYQKWFLDIGSGTPLMPKIALSGKNGKLRMGTCLLAEPFAFSSNGEKVGFDIELGYRLAEILGVKLEITDMSYDAMIAALHAGKIDIAIANFYKLTEREKLFDFSVPYMQNEITAVVRRGK